MSYQNFIKKIFFFSFILIILPVNAQNIKKQFYKDSLSYKELAHLNLVFGKNKSFDSIYQKQILIALSYFPELKNISIEFKLKIANTPLSSRPTFFGFFQSAKKRKYIIFISEQTNTKLEPILFKNLSFNAQIGVLGHELSHISDYTNKGFSEISNILWIEIFSKKEVDKFENRTDHICINHGLGYQLFEWSSSVINNLKIEYWRGADNLKGIIKRGRYLNPETIINIINTSPIYNQDKLEK